MTTKEVDTKVSGAKETITKEGKIEMSLFLKRSVTAAPTFYVSYIIIDPRKPPSIAIALGRSSSPSPSYFNQFYFNRLLKMPVAPKSKKGKGTSDAAAYKTAIANLGPNPKRNAPWALAALKRERARDFVVGAAVYSNLMASAQALETVALASGIQKPN
jgi:hypothetical protein